LGVLVANTWTTPAYMRPEVFPPAFTNQINCIMERLKILRPKIPHELMDTEDSSA
jgi:hypothetical protein